MNNPILLLIMITCTILVAMTMFQVRAMEETRSGARLGARRDDNDRPVRSGGEQCNTATPGCYRVCLYTVEHNVPDIETVGTTNNIIITAFSDEASWGNRYYFSTGISQGGEECFHRTGIELQQVKRVRVEILGQDDWVPKFITVTHLGERFCCLAYSAGLCSGTNCAVSERHPRNITCGTVADCTAS